MAQGADNNPAPEVEYLLAVLETVQRHGPAEAATWFSDGVDRFMAGDGRLDSCLGLEPRDQIGSPARSYLLWRRDQHLKAAHGHCAGGSPWARTLELERQIEKFSATWSNYQELSEPSPRWSGLWKSLFYAFQCGLDIPRRRRLHEIVRSGVGPCRAEGFSGSMGT